MKSALFEVGSRIRVASYCPFRGLAGTVRTVDVIPSSQHSSIEAYCFYLIDLEGALIKEPVWFEDEEIESVSVHEDKMIPGV